MTDLKNGIIDIGGFEITPNTTLEELIKYTQNKGYNFKVTPTGSFFKIFKSFFVEHQEFSITFYFENGVISYLEMSPYLDNYGENRVETQKLLRIASDTWMKNLLGTPEQKTKTITGYNFKWGSIYSVVSDNPLGNYNGGHIKVDFREISIE